MVRIGFIGTGPRAQGLIRNCKLVDGIRITALCDKYETLLAKAHQATADPDVKCYTDHSKMLKEADLDAVYVVVEPSNCPDLVVESLEAGKHVLSEVPAAQSIEACWALVTTVEKTGLKYMLGEQVRYRPFVREWKRMIEDGTLGKIVYAEGQYLHGMTDDRFFMDPDTGARLTVEEAEQHPNPRKSRFWHSTHPILYLPHELSPMLHALSDRVTSVVCMGTRPQSYVHEWLPKSDLETALMHTEKDTVLRLSCGFTILMPSVSLTGCHWYSMMGTKGSVETHRANTDKMKRWRPTSQKDEPEEIMWDYDRSQVPAEALKSGHQGADYWPVRYFVEAIENDTVPEMDVYKAVETAAPAVLAAQSAEQDGVRLKVPEFRPGPHREPGHMPDSGHE